jgi:hypothetical protein
MLSIEMRMTFASLGGMAAAAALALGAAESTGAALVEATAVAGGLVAGIAAADDVAGTGSGVAVVREHAVKHSRAAPRPPRT